MASKTNTGKPFEVLVQKIYQALLKSDGITNVAVEHDQDLTGMSGVPHQIDVLWRYRQAGVEHLVIVQAKDWSSNVPLGEMLTFDSVLRDIPGQPRGLFVTKTGFQRSAHDFAKQKGINLLTLHEKPQIVLNLTGNYPVIRPLGMDIDYEWCKVRMTELGLVEEDFPAQVELTTRSELFDNSLAEYRLVEDVFTPHFPVEGSLSPTTITENLGKFCLMKIPSSPKFPYIKVNSITAELHKTVTTKTFTLEDVVKYVLADLMSGSRVGFDKEFTISTL